MKKIISILSFLITVNVNAALINNGSYVTDTVAGFDWLKLQNTIGLSSDEIRTQSQAGGAFEGWRYARGFEWDDLLIGQGLTPESCANGTAFCTENYSNSGLDGTQTRDLMALIGFVPESITPLPHDNAMGILADVDPVTGSQWVTSLFLDWYGQNLELSPFVTTRQRLEPNQNPIGGEFVGSWLVRKSVSVSEPATLPIVMLALSGLFFIRRV